MKVNIELFGLYELVKIDAIDTDIKSFNTKNEIITTSVDLNLIINTWFEVKLNLKNSMNKIVDGRYWKFFIWK